MLTTFAYCAATFRDSVAKAAGVEPVTCPPYQASSGVPLIEQQFKRMQAADFLYFKLHGLPDQGYWYGDQWVTALTAEQLRSLDLSQARAAFVANCFLPESPMLAALFEAGCPVVVGGYGPNYARASEVDGADLLGLWFRRFLSTGARPQLALALSRVRLAGMPKTPALRDALAFELWRRPDGV